MQLPRPNALSGLTPVLFAGPGAADADHSALAVAQQMQQAGRGPDEIWRSTGWFADAGGWSFESSPSMPPAYSTPGTSPRKRAVPLSSVSDDPAFARSYPHLIDTPVTMPSRGLGEDIAAMYFPPSGPSGSHVIAIDPRDAVTPKAGYFVQHEKQHLIDRTEGLSDQPDLPWGLQRKERRAINGAYRDLRMTPDQRLARPPWRTEDEAFREMHSQTYMSTPLNALARVAPY